MKWLFQGFLDIFGALGNILTLGNSRESREIEKILEQSEKRQNWYHQGEWYHHPMWCDTWKDKK